ncbi:LamG-like jellyroll fold domain-containing protein [Streptomyces sp. GESEQ-35]|uniref:protein kinase domain-containing protein n=1 Tax=Streptomyces sp. GESEQ-35 TaxID=2812657 RepID=UPI001B332880|nr:LamG-like jellyroll fold domain-containing protein [Streptomyces sp. GESEQ-35]
MAALEPDDPASVGDYRLLSRLGAGGMGRVYLGRSPGGRLVAVKVVHAELVRRPEFRSRFRREVRAARLVSGAFTAPVIDADPDATQPWLVTSYIAGPSLAQRVAENGPMSPEAVLGLAAGLAEALLSIHSVNLVHRDLKPSNVLLAEDGPRVIDFGIVRTIEADSITSTGSMAGSPGFMSPEQVSGDEVAPASDVFCLGAVLAFAATGGNPFGGGPTPALLYRVVHNEPDVQAIADPALRSLISACLTKDPAGRPTPREILARVGPAGGEDIVAMSRAAQWQSAPASGAAPLPHPAVHDASAHPAAHEAGTPPVAPTPATRPHPRTPTQPDPDHPATQSDSAGAPPSLSEPHQQTAFSTPAAPPRARNRRAFLLSGAGVLAATGTGAGFWLNRSARDDAADKERAGTDGTGAAGGASPAPSATPRRPQPVGVWRLGEASGNVVRATVGGRNGTATDVRWNAGKDGAAAFDGSSSQVVIDGPVLQTGPGRSFTVAAWVCLPAEPDSFATAVSQAAASDSGFYLQYSGAEKRWAFARPGLWAVGYTVPAMNTWTHLAGVCDGPARKLRLYVNGVQEAAIDDTNPTVSTGPLLIGRAQYQGRPSGFFPGSIKDVRVFGQALTAARIKTLP